MAIQEPVQSVLNEQQVMMLRLLKNPMAENDFLQLRQLAVKLLAKQLDETVQEWEIKNNITEQGYEQLANKHLRGTAKQS